MPCSAGPNRLLTPSLSKSSGGRIQTYDLWLYGPNLTGALLEPLWHSPKDPVVRSLRLARAYGPCPIARRDHDVRTCSAAGTDKNAPWTPREDKGPDNGDSGCVAPLVAVV